MTKQNGLMKKVKQLNPYELIPRSLLQHERLSLQAIGLLCNLVSYPDNWKLYKSELYKRFPKNKETSVRNAFTELVEEKYIVEIKERDGKRWAYTYYFATEPFTEEDIQELYAAHEIEPINLETGKSSPQQKGEEILGTGFSRPQNEDPKMGTPKPRSNRIHTEENTQKDNPYKNNKHQSIDIEEKIKKLDVPQSIQNVFMKQIDRLIEYNFDLDEIELSYKANEHQLTENQYAHLLSIALKEIRNPIQTSTANFMQKVVENYCKSTIDVSNKDEKASPHHRKRKDIVPKWLLDEKENEQTEVMDSHTKTSNDTAPTYDEMLEALKHIQKVKS